MSLPTALMAASTVAQVAGSAEQGMAAGTAAKAEQQTANFQAQVARNNAIIAQQNAEAETAAGTAQAEAKGLEGAGRIGDILAGEAAGNVDVNTGSNLSVRKSARQLANLDELTIRSIAARKAYGYQLNANEATNQANLYASEARYAPIAGDIGQAGSLLGGASSLAGKWATWSQFGSNPFSGGGSPGGATMGKELLDVVGE